MTEEKKVSIIIPVYKVERYLDQCMVSIVNQTYKNLEIILVDDGSPDQCPQSCDKWAKKDNRIKVIHKANGGLSDARNCGLKISTGKYLLFVDSDDWIVLNMVEKMVTAIEKDNSDMAICQFVMFYQDGTTEKSVSDIYENVAISNYEAINLLLEDNRISNHAWRKLYKKELFNEEFPVGKNYEDIYITWKLILACRKISLLDDPLYFYRQNDTGIIANNSVKNLWDFFEGIVTATEGIEEQYPNLRNSLNNYRFQKSLYILQLLNEKCNETYSNDWGELKNEILGYVSKIKLYGLYGYKNKLKYLYLKLFHKARIKKTKSLIKMNNIFEKENFIKNYKGNNQKNFWIFGTPEYGNLGDHLLLKGEIEFVSYYFPDYKIRTIPIDKLDIIDEKICDKLIKEKDICAIQAGGNMGTLYPWIHDRQEHMIEILKNRKTIIFPQTFFYSSDEHGKEILNKSKKVYDSKKNVIIFCRDKKSYELVNKNFKTSTFCVPDIALFLKSNTTPKNRNGVIYCLRTDGEATVSVENKDFLYKIVNKYYRSIDVCDTHVYVPLKPQQAEKQIKNLFDKFSSAELVITDRLHGMITAAITQTPCIVLNSKSYKITGVYQWIRNIPYIKMVSDFNNLESELVKLKDIDFNTKIDLGRYWNQMFEIITKICEEKNEKIY